MVRSSLGNWCGYVAVPPGHPAHGKHYDNVDVDAHGGLTFSGACEGQICHVPKPGEPDDVWWLGFDCAHGGDVVPGLAAHWHFLSDYIGESYKGVEWVKWQVRKLAGQLARMGR
jgi:hypothetical protein